VHRTTRSLSIAAAVLTVGALALPVSAAIADTSSTDDSSVAATDDSTTSTGATQTEAPETEAPETDAPETDAPETDAPETEAPHTDGDDDQSGSESGSAPTESSAPAPVQQVAAPWHVKARLIDADSAVVSWRDADATGPSFSVTLVPVGSAAASALPALPAAGSTRSVQFDGLVAGTRYRATVTATTTDGAAVSAPSNVVVAPKAKHPKAGHAGTKSAKHAESAQQSKHAKVAKVAKVAKPAKTTHKHASRSDAKHSTKPLRTKHSSHHGH
jgi:hypothetical protein